MDFRAHQRFDATAGEVIARYADPDVRVALGAIGKLSAPELVEHRAEDGQVRLRLRYHYVGDLPGGAHRFISPDLLTWVQDSRFDLAAGREDLAIVPDHYGDRLEAGAVATVTGDHPATRKAEGHLRVHLPLVGGRVEHAIVEGLTEHLELEAALMAERLASS